MRRKCLDVSILLYISFIGSASCLAQGRQMAPAIAIQINGQVRYREGTPAENLVVRLEAFSGAIVGEAITDRTGKFHFSSLSQGQYLVSVHLSGYRDIRQTVDLETATSQYLLLQLIADSGTTGAVTRSSAGEVDATVPVVAQSEFDKAQAALGQEHIKQGIRHLEKAVAIHPAFYQAQLLLGTSYMDEGEWEKAEPPLLRAVQLEPKRVAARFALGEVFLRQKHWRQAEEALIAGLKLEDHSWQAHLALGRVYWETGDIVKAGPQVGRALQLKPDLAEAHLLAGNILLRARQPQNALVEFDEYLRLVPNGELSNETRIVVERIKKALAEKKDFKQ